MAEVIVSNTKGNQKVNWLSVQAAIPPSLRRSELKGTFEILSSRLKGDAVICIYPPRPNLLSHAVCVF
jgi:hypothetical protein